MKHTLVAVLMLLSVGTLSAATKADTVSVNSAKIERIIEQSTTNSKGAPVKKYWVLYDGELIATSKTVIEKYELCKKYGARIALAMVKRGKSKRIILN